MPGRGAGLARRGSIALALCVLAFPLTVASAPAAPSDPAFPNAEDRDLGSPLTRDPDETVLPDLPDRPDRRAEETTNRPWWRHNLFARFWSDQKFLVAHWWPSEIRHAGFTAPLLISTFAASQSSNSSGFWGFDLSVERRFDAATTGTSQRIFEHFSTAGNNTSVALGLGGAWLLAHFTDNERLLRATSLSAEALLDEGLYIEALKGISARTRPSGGGTGQFFQYQPPSGQSNSSFPSGHALGAFTVATVFAHVYSDHKWVPWVAYGSAVMVGASRVALGRHFPSDVVVGSVLGNSFGRMVVARDGGDRPSALSRFQPIVDPATRGYGLSWSYAWGGARPAHTEPRQE